MPLQFLAFFFFNDTATTEIYTLSLHDALPCAATRGARGAEALRGLAFHAAVGSEHGALQARARRNRHPHRRAVGPVDAAHTDRPRVFLAATHAVAVCRPGRAVPRDVLLGLVLHDARSGGEWTA